MFWNKQGLAHLCLPCYGINPILQPLLLTPNRNVFTGATGTTVVEPKFSDTLTLSLPGGRILATISEVATKFSPWLRPCAQYIVPGMFRELLASLCNLTTITVEPKILGDPGLLKLKTCAL